MADFRFFDFEIFYPSRFFTHLIELVEMSEKLHITNTWKGLQNFLEIFKGSKKPIFRVSILLNWGSPQPSYRDMLYRRYEGVFQNFHEKRTSNTDNAITTSSTTKSETIFDQKPDTLYPISLSVKWALSVTIEFHR